MYGFMITQDPKYRPRYACSVTVPLISFPVVYSRTEQWWFSVVCLVAFICDRTPAYCKVSLERDQIHLPKIYSSVNAETGMFPFLRFKRESPGWDSSRLGVSQAAGGHRWSFRLRLGFHSLDNSVTGIRVPQGTLGTAGSMCAGKSSFHHTTSPFL